MGSPQLTGTVPATRAGRYAPAFRFPRYAADRIRVVARLLLAIVACMVVAGLVPVLFGWHSYVVLSGSMTPGVRVGDVVIAAPVHPGDLAPGRIVVFPDPAEPGRLLVHRIRGLNPDGTVVTKGDANGIADSTPVRRDAVRGLVRLRLPMIGLPLYWWQAATWTPVIASLVLLVSLFAVASGGAEPPADRRPAPRHRWVAVHRHLAGAGPA